MLDDITQLIGAVKGYNLLKSLPAIAIGVTYIAISVIFWTSSDPLLNLISFGLFQILGTVLLYIFASNPLDWIAYIVQVLSSIWLTFIRWSIVAIKYVLVGVLYLVYLISPVDIIPGDMITIIGLLDDIVLGLLYGGWVMNAHIQRPDFDLDFSTPEAKTWFRWGISAGLTFLVLASIR
jgi:archaellum biogenesis protein FlaJ (TadC family)